MSNEASEDEGIAVDTSKPVNPLSMLWMPDVADYAFPDVVNVVPPVSHECLVGKRLRVDTDLDTGECSMKLTHRSVRGWHGTAAVRTNRPPSVDLLEMRFCPGDYLFGHNAFGSNNLADVLMRLYVDNWSRFHLHPEAHVRLDGFEDDAELHELDITAMIDLGGLDAVRALIDCGEYGSHRYMCKLKRYPDTLVFGEGEGHHYSVKLYDKWSEMKFAEKKADYLSESWGPALKWAEGRLRVEMHLKRKKLQALGRLRQVT